MNPTIFISYRREDVGAEAGRLASDIRQRIGEDKVFLDTSGIRPGTPWPDTIQTALERAETVLVVVGRNWLKISDEYGMRRIDQEDDWVRREVETALAMSKKILPVFVNEALALRPDKLPRSIASLATLQKIDIRRDYWDHDVQLVLSQLGANSSSSQVRLVASGTYPVPPPEKPDPLSDNKIEFALAHSLNEWRKICTPLPEDPSQVRIELYRQYKFLTFIDAIAFMAEVAPGCNIANHHPRWENIWKTLRVYLTTWDIGHRISDRDIQLAKYFDSAYTSFPGKAQD